MSAMNNPGIHHYLDRAKGIIKRSPKRADTVGALAKFLMPDHEPLNARIRVNEWLSGRRTPTDFGVCTRIVEWVKARGKP